MKTDLANIAQEIIDAIMKSENVGVDALDKTPQPVIATPTGDVTSFSMVTYHATKPNLRVDYTVTIVAKIINVD